MKKKLTAFFLAALMTAGMLTGCGGTDSDNTAPANDSGSSADTGGAASSSSYRMGYSMPSRDQFQTSMQMAIEAKAEAEGIEISVLDANGDVATQLSHVQTWADGLRKRLSYHLRQQERLLRNRYCTGR